MRGYCICCVHCREERFIGQRFPKGGDFAPQGPRDFPRVGILRPKAAFSQALWCKIPVLGKFLVPRGYISQ